MEKGTPIRLPRMRMASLRSHKMRTEVSGRELQNHDEHVVEALMKVVYAASQTGMDYFIDGGTLIGFYRDSGEILGGDADVAIFAPSLNQRFLDTLGPRHLEHRDTEVLYRNCSSVIRALNSEECLSIKCLRYSIRPGVHCDIVLLFPYKDGWIYKFTSGSFVPSRKEFYTFLPGQLLSKFDHLVLHNQRFRVPANVEGYLEWLFGPSWRIPDPKFDYANAPEHIWCLRGKEYRYSFVSGRSQIVDKDAVPPCE